MFLQQNLYALYYVANLFISQRQQSDYESQK